MFSFACAIVELIKQEYIHHYFLNNETRVQKENFDGIFSCFEVIFVQNGTFKMIRRLPRMKKTPFFLKKTKSFDSKDFVLALLTLRFLEKRRRFLTVKTPSFSGRPSICLQGVEIQSFA